MITIQNDKNQEKYEVLFQAATNDLVKASMNDSDLKFEATFVVIDIDEDDYINNPGQYFVNVDGKFEYATGDFSAETTYYKAEGIRTLEEFFGHLQDLYRLNPKYIMLPLDEEPFKIDADKRTITVPNSFKSGVTVQGDIIAETLLFTINRFFDAVDLSSCEMYVQWERAKDTTQYVTPIADLIDVNSETIMFGWPLSEQVADIAGQIKFSVRFIKRDGNKIVYSFSTMPTTINIYQGLDYDIDNCASDSANLLFDAVITNSESTVGPSAVRPVFVTNLDEEISYLGEDGTAALAVMARVSDGGDIFYEWYNSENANAIGTRVSESHPETGNASVFTVDGVNNENITGYYWAKAINKLNNKQKTVQSKTTYFPAPNEPAFANEFADTILEDGAAALEVAMKPDSHGVHNTVAYQWLKKDTMATEGEFVEIEDATASALSIDAPGVYKVKATNTVNRQSKSVFGTPCIVYDTPGAVVFANDIDDIMISGQEYTLAVTLPTSEFALGEVKYAWYLDYDAGAGILVDGVPSESDKKVDYLDGLDTPKIKITADLLTMAAGASLYCVASNTITVGGKSVTTYSESVGYTLKR